MGTVGIYIQYIYNKNCGVSFWTCSREISGDRVALFLLSWDKTRYSKMIMHVHIEQGLLTIFIRQHHVRRMDWPAYSPDRNPIENVWDHLGRTVQRRLNINSTLADLRRYLLEKLDRLFSNWYTACVDDVIFVLPYTWLNCISHK